MSVPGFQSFLRPLLELASDGNEHAMREAREIISRNLRLTEADLFDLVLGGTQPRFDNRVAWAKSYLLKAKCLEATKRAHFRITDRGQQLLLSCPGRIDLRTLEQYPEFIEFRTSTHDNSISTEIISPSMAETPEELLQGSYQKIRNELASELLTRVKNNSPRFFELLVVDLLIAMGYGGSRADAGKALGQTGDEGIDGIIKEDRLGLDIIYLQAKRWEGTVGRPEIQKFVGALHGKRAKKGVFITTGKFSDDAHTYVDTIDPKVILIDGNRLASLMIDFNIGATTVTNYEVKKVDSDYFEVE